MRPSSAYEALLRRGIDAFDLLDQLPDGVFVIDREGAPCFQNRASEAILGTPLLPNIKAEQLIEAYKVFLESTDEPYPADKLPLFRGLRGEHASAGDVDIHSPSGVVGLQVSAGPLEDEAGARIGAVATFSDVTTRRSAERRLRLLFESTPLGIIEWNRSFCVVEWNSYAERIFGYSRSEMLGKHADLIVPESARANVHDVWERLLRKDQLGSRSTNENVTRDGRHIKCEWYNAFVRDEQGQVTGVVSIVDDVTKRVREQERAQRSEALVRAIIDHLPARVFVRDMEGRYLHANDAYARELGREPTQLLGKSDSELFDAELSERLIAMDREVLASGEARSWEEPSLSSSGARTFFSVRFPLRDERGDTYAVAGVSSDITVQREAEQRLMRAQRVETSARVLSGVAHDLNNLLTAILVTAQLAALRISPDDRVHHDLMRLADVGETAGHMVRRLLSFAGGSAGPATAFVVDDAVSDVAKLMRRLVGENVELNLQLAESGTRVLMDPGQFEQVLINLILNARDAMPRGGTITLSSKLCSERERSMVEVAVRDTGEGMAPDIQKRLFEPFFTTKPAGRGTGLGLSTSRSIVETAAGELRFSSEPGRGSTFVVRLPATLERTSQRAVTAAQPLAVHGSGRAILLVEDNPLVRAATRSLLEEQGFEVLQAGNGDEALSLPHKRLAQVDLVLTDVLMPIMGGLTLAQRLWAFRPDLPVLFVSAHNERDVDEDSLRARRTGWLRKPYRTGELSQEICRLLEDDKGAHALVG